MNPSGEILSKDQNITGTISEVFAFPASNAQEQLWFLNQLEPNKPIYSIPLIFRIVGTIHIAALEGSINEIVKRHETFRTTFTFENGSLQQIITSKNAISVEIIDLINHHEKEKEALVRLRRLLSIPFNLYKGPLVKTFLIVLGEKDAILLINFHHIIMDYFSVHLFTNELTAIYNAFVEGNNHSLPQPTLQYADVVVWQHKDTQSKTVSEKLAFWEEHLKDQIQFLEFPTDSPRPSRQTFNGAAREIQISKEITDKLKELSRKERKSFFTLLLTAFKILLYRYTNKTDITIGVPFTNRQHSGLEEVMGCCMNTLPLRTIFSDKDSFLEVLEKVYTVTISAQSNQEVSFEQIVEHVHPFRDASFNPLFQVSLMFDEEPLKLNLKGLECSAIEMHNGTSIFDCLLWLRDSSDGLKGIFEYNTDLFKKETIDRLINNFSTLLQGIVSSPQLEVSRLPLLSYKEEESIFNDWNKNFSFYPKQLCVQHLFENSAIRLPEKIAIDFDNNKITYRELNEKANQLAHYLQEQGVGPDSLVGIYIERSIMMIIGLLGILKAGGAYVPMDPSFPKDRLNYMLEDAGIKILLTQKKLSDKFSDFYINEICVDTDWQKIRLCKVTNPIKSSSSGNLAYVIYTSGSTGRPKGVQIEHRSLVNFLYSMMNEPGLTEKDVLLSVTTLSFDIAGLELFLPLIAGAKVILSSKENSIEGKSLLNLIQNKEVTIMQATPSTWRLMLLAGWDKRLGIKILCGGEALPRELANKLIRLEGSLWNMYGPTETTIWSAVKKIDSTEGPVLIGKPIANTQFYILDQNNQPVPIGVAGELHIGGDGLSRGYFNLPDLTKERFITNPFDAKVNNRLYKTGDLMRYHPDGFLEFLGRLDDQVKVRGFRIELGEIETVLARNPEVKQVVLSTHQVADGDIRIIAYIVHVNNKRQASTSLREYLKTLLPEYMVPSHFEFLNEMPLTPNGKIDRKALPKPNLIKIITNSINVLPRNKLELKITRIWEKLLGVKGIYIDDNFFELGGHSMLAAQMFLDLEKETNIKVPLASLFKAQTIRAITQLIDEEKIDEIWSPLVEIKKGLEKDPLFLIHGAEGNILLYRELSKYLDEGRALYGLQSIGLNGTGYIPETIKEMAAYYIQAIKKVQPTGPYNIGGYCLGGTIALEMAQQLSAASDEVKNLFMLETYNVCFSEDNVRAENISGSKFENIHFHLDNIKGLRGRDRVKFISQKAEVLIRRVIAKINSFLDKIGISLINSPGTSKSTFKIRDINDKAQAEYRPEIYKGKMILLRPKISYSTEPDPEFGWGNFVEGELKVYTIDAAPRGMLTEPFVKETSKIIDKELKSIKKNEITKFPAVFAKDFYSF